MGLPATARLGLAQYEDGENASFSAQINAITSRLDAIVGRFEHGALAARRGFGVPGANYLATDGSKSGLPEGDLYYDTGAAWVGPRNVATSAPIGAVTDYAGLADPVDPDGVTRWLIMDGRAISRATYAALFAKWNGESVEGKTLVEIFGVGNGMTTFNLPIGTGRVSVMPGASGVTRVGSTGGEQAHALSVEELAPHTHPEQSFYKPAAGANFGESAFAGINASNSGAAGAVATGGTGGGVAHNNMQPYIGLNKIVRVL